MTDPFNNPPASAPMNDPFANADGLVDPFSPLATGGSFGPGPRMADQDNKLVALRIRRLEDGQKYQAPPGVTELRGVVDIAILDGGMITAPAPKDAPFGTPRIELGEAPMLFKGRYWSNKGVLNKFPAVQARFSKLPDKIGEQAIEFTDKTAGVFIVGRLGRMPANKDVQTFLKLSSPFTEADLLLVNAWLATNPLEEQVKQAELFRTLVDVSPENRALAVKWVNENPEFTA